MKIKRIDITNFRLLKNFSIDLESELSLVIGKNNTGKTSLLLVLDKFINSSDKNRLIFDDFNTELKDELEALAVGNTPDEQDYSPKGVKVRIHIEYNDDDDLSAVSYLIMSLDPEDKAIILEFAYELDYTNLLRLKTDFQTQSKNYDNVGEFLKENLSTYFGKIKRRSISSKEEEKYIDLGNISLKDVLAFEFISAKRAVTNKDTDRTLSSQTSKIYKKTSESDEQADIIETFKRELRDTDKSLTTIYNNLFKKVVDNIKEFGGIKKNDTLINIVSTLQHGELLDGNTTVFYKHGKYNLPEHYNGLGYMNLISMIFEIEVLIGKLKRSLADNPAALNLLFIEEPEAHTHPQMQYVFINNIKSLLNKSRVRSDHVIINLQTIISTHSSHIVSESDFDEIKYLKISGNNSVESKNFKALEAEYSGSNPEKQHFKFLKQYLTLNRSELFFADKIILIEGETERILLPAMMKKIDQEYNAEPEAPLLSQNISIVEVGAHSKIFEKFINFIGARTLIITDIDSNYYIEEEITKGTVISKNTRYFSPDHGDAKVTTNSSLIYFFNRGTYAIDYFLTLVHKDKIFSKIDGKWENNEEGELCIAYQTLENGFYARSFEDAFFNINKDLLVAEGYEAFPSLTNKWCKKYISEEIEHLEFSIKAVNKKPQLAIEILLNSRRNEETGYEFSNWRIPNYLREGLEWLRKN